MLLLVVCCVGGAVEYSDQRKGGNEMPQQTCMVTHYKGDNAGIEIEKSTGELEVLTEDDAKIATVLANLANEGWEHEEFSEGNPEYYILKRTVE